MKPYQRLFETFSETVKIRDLYDEGDFEDDSEPIAHLADLGSDTEYEVFSLPPLELENLLTKTGDMDVILAYNEYAEPWQKKLVKEKMKNFDEDRIVVLKGKRVIDGNHQVVAGILSNKPVKAIDLDKPL